MHSIKNLESEQGLVVAIFYAKNQAVSSRSFVHENMTNSGRICTARLRGGHVWKKLIVIAFSLCPTVFCKTLFIVITVPPDDSAPFGTWTSLVVTIKLSSFREIETSWRLTDQEGAVNFPV